MRHESNNIQHEAKHVANELHHLHGNHNEKALHHIQKELHDEHNRNPHHFNQLLKEINKDLKKDHDHRHLGVEHNHKGQVSHVNFDHHDIYGHSAHKKQEQKKEHISGKPTKEAAPSKDDSGSGYLDSSNSKPTPSKDTGSGYLDSSNSRPSRPDTPVKPYSVDI